MQDLLRAFLSEPGAESFEPLRTAVLEDPSYAPYSQDLSQADEALAQDQLSRAEQLLHEGMPNLVLSANAHVMLSWIAHQRGEEDAAATEGFLARICVEAILSTGEGTLSRPYRVLRVEDEYDVLRYLQRRPKGQRLVEDGGRKLDCITCTDGAELWFDVSDPHGWIARNQHR